MTTQSMRTDVFTGRTGEENRAEPWFWGFILADMSVFAMFFGAYLWRLGENRAEFTADASHLNLAAGTFNTIVLLLSSYAVVRALHLPRAAPSETARWLRLALAGGVVFVVVKFGEYAFALVHGHGLTTSEFYGYYFVLTALHLMHVGIGSILLACWLRVTARGHHPVSGRWAESSAGYWHMVDLIWIIIFALLYIGSHQ